MRFLHLKQSLVLFLKISFEIVTQSLQTFNLTLKFVYLLFALPRLILDFLIFFILLKRKLVEILLSLLKSVLQIYWSFFLTSQHFLIFDHFLLSVKQFQTLLFKERFKIKVDILRLAEFKLFIHFYPLFELISKVVKSLLDLFMGTLFVCVHLFQLWVQMHNSCLVVPI